MIDRSHAAESSGTIVCECGAVADQPCPYGKPECATGEAPSDAASLRGPWWWPVYRFAMRLRHGPQWPMSTDPIPPQDIERAAQLARERGWADA
jgi:hypothetical protein